MGDASERASTDIRSSARRIDDGFGQMSEGADVAETRIMGVRDIVDGTAAVMAGPGEAGISAYLQGWADLASGIVNAVIPALSAVTKGLMANVAAAARATAAVVANIARQVASWVVLGAQSLIHAAKVAAAWLISMGPIGLIIAAVVGLVAIIIKNWDTISRVIRSAGEAIMSWARSAWRAISDLFAQPFAIAKTLIEGYINVWFSVLRGAVRIVKTIFAAVKDHITRPFRAAFDLVKSIWNGTIGGRRLVPRVEIPSWAPIPGAGSGFGPITIPRMHSGGIVPGPAGTDVPIMAQAGERIVARGAAGASSITVNVSALDPRGAADAVLEALTIAIRQGGRSQVQELMGVGIS